MSCARTHTHKCTGVVYRVGCELVCAHLQQYEGCCVDVEWSTMSWAYMCVVAEMEGDGCETHVSVGVVGHACMRLCGCDS